MDTRTIGNFLKELRKEKGLTREQLGEEALIHAYGFTDCFGSLAFIGNTVNIVAMIYNKEQSGAAR